MDDKARQAVIDWVYGVLKDNEGNRITPLIAWAVASGLQQQLAKVEEAPKSAEEAKDNPEPN